MTKDFLMIIMTTVFTDNTVFAKGLGICPVIGRGDSIRTAASISLMTSVIMLLSAAACWPIFNLVLLPMGIEFMETVCFVLIIAGLVQISDILMKRFSPAMHQKLGIFLPLTATNCAILGICEQSASNGSGFMTSMYYALGTALGFTLAMLLFAGIRLRSDDSEMPECFKGTASGLISAGILSLAFMGLDGLIERFFGM